MIQPQKCRKHPLIEQILPRTTLQTGDWGEETADQGQAADQKRLNPTRDRSESPINFGNHPNKTLHPLKAAETDDDYITITNNTMPPAIRPSFAHQSMAKVRGSSDAMGATAPGLDTQDFYFSSQEANQHPKIAPESGHWTNKKGVNFQDRTALRNQMDPRTSSEELEEQKINMNYSLRGSSPNKDVSNYYILKSSSKYSKPPILQNTSAFGLGSSGMRGHQSLGGANNRSMRANPDHDDLKLKLDKLVANFVTKNGEKDAFKDTFFDQEIFQEIVDSKNYFKLSLDLLKYVLHSGNQPKKKKDDGKKKAGYGK